MFLPRDITHCQARFQGWWWLLHPSRCPTSSPSGRSSGPCSWWSWLLPAESLRVAHEHINSERQIATQARAGSWLIPSASAADIPQLLLRWQLSGYLCDGFPAPHITAAAVTDAVKVWRFWVGVRRSTLWPLIYSPTSLRTHNNGLTSCVPVRWVRPSSWSPCSPSFR